MFQVGDYVVYGTTGVCLVLDVGMMDLSESTRDRLYYTLSPLGDRDGKIYTPVDNQKVILRSVLTKGQAEELIDDIRNIGTLWVKDEKRREEIYKEVLRKCDCREWVKIIKTLYLRRQSRLAEGKKVTAVDERYLKMVEMNLYGELAIALEIEKEEVGEYIYKRVAEQKAAEGHA